MQHLRMDALASASSHSPGYRPSSFSLQLPPTGFSTSRSSRPPTPAAANATAAADSSGGLQGPASPTRMLLAKSISENSQTGRPSMQEDDILVVPQTPIRALGAPHASGTGMAGSDDESKMTLEKVGTEA